VAKKQSRGRVGVVEDEAKIIRLLKSTLEADAFEVEVASDAAGALALVESSNLDLLLLDIGLPGGMDGYDVLRRIREFSSLPIIMVTSRTGDTDIVRGLEAGADDYITKPLPQRQLLARVHAVLRRSQFGPEDRREPVFANGELTIDYTQHLVTMRGGEVPLTPTEYRLIACLAQNVGRTLLQEDLLLQVWGPGYEGEAHLLRVNIARLRAKLSEEATTPRYVLTRPGAGYMMPALNSDPAGSHP
jgi:DNA-binding response OmpR family regulator